MDRDRSLDEFVDGESTDSAADADADVEESDSAESDADTEVDDSADLEIDADGSVAEADPKTTPAEEESNDDADESDNNTATPPDDVEPAAVTYRWEPEGSRCTDCGATVEQLWSGESGPVCDECKEW